jgi:hypothetical protein
MNFSVINILIELQTDKLSTPKTNYTLYFIGISIGKSLQDLTVLPTEFFRQRKTHIPLVINLQMESLTEMLRR